MLAGKWDLNLSILDEKIGFLFESVASVNPDSRNFLTATSDSSAKLFLSNRLRRPGSFTSTTREASGSDEDVDTLEREDGEQ